MFFLFFLRRWLLLSLPVPGRPRLCSSIPSIHANLRKLYFLFVSPFPISRLLVFLLKPPISQTQFQGFHPPARPSISLVFFCKSIIASGYIEEINWDSIYVFYFSFSISRHLKPHKLTANYLLSVSSPSPFQRSPSFLNLSSCVRSSHTYSQ